MAGPSWLAWRVVLIAAMGEALTGKERAVFTRLTGRHLPKIRGDWFPQTLR
jgi:hypothetical protein